MEAASLFVVHTSGDDALFSITLPHHRWNLGISLGPPTLYSIELQRFHFTSIKKAKANNRH